MKYMSTRGSAEEIGFSDALLAGLASDGGLYVPIEWPHFSAAEIEKMRGLSYSELAFELLKPFVGGEIEDLKLKSIIDDAYGTFHHEAVCPLVQTRGNEFILELFHGTTLAFKDVAMQLLARLMDHVLTERDLRATIVGATSGDTGGAAIDAFANRDRTDVFILYPHGRVSDVQRHQMTTVDANNVHALAVEGSFDDCQSLVKDMFNDKSFRETVKLSGVNSINWARIMAQIVYYFYSASSLGAPSRAISFTVPTGNFGDIFAGYAAKRMGLPIDKLVIATNDNDILARTLATGRYETRPVVPTTSPSMDIQISSNFERLMFEAGNRNSEMVKRAMDLLKQSGAFNLEPDMLASVRSDFSAGRATMNEAGQTIGNLFRSSGYLCDPHTAVGVYVARMENTGSSPMVILATAHPAKFPDAVEKAAGVTPELPDWLGDLMDREEKYTVVQSDLKKIEEIISKRARVSA